MSNRTLIYIRSLRHERQNVIQIISRDILESFHSISLDSKFRAMYYRTKHYGFIDNYEVNVTD